MVAKFEGKNHTVSHIYKTTVIGSVLAGWLESEKYENDSDETSCLYRCDIHFFIHSRVYVVVVVVVYYVPCVRAKYRF